jgi:hypothetical protein
MSDNIIIELAAMCVEALEASVRGTAAAVRKDAIIVGDSICGLHQQAAKIRALKQPEPQAIRSKPRGLQEPAPAEPPGSPTVREEDDPAPINSILGKRTEHGVHYSADDAAPKLRECWEIRDRSGARIEKLSGSSPTRECWEIRDRSGEALYWSKLEEVADRCIAEVRGRTKHRMVELRAGEDIYPMALIESYEETRDERDRLRELLRRAYKTLTHIAEHCSQDGTRRMAAGEAEQIAAALGIGGE